MSAKIARPRKTVRWSMRPPLRNSAPHPRPTRHASPSRERCSLACQRDSLRADGFSELALIEVVVEAMPGEELVVGALLDDAALVHDHDLVGVADRREAMRDHE